GLADLADDGLDARAVQLGRSAGVPREPEHLVSRAHESRRDLTAQVTARAGDEDLAMHAALSLDVSPSAALRWHVEPACRARGRASPCGLCCVLGSGSLGRCRRSDPVTWMHRWWRWSHRPPAGRNLNMS